MTNAIGIDPLSGVSLSLECSCQGANIHSGTGFVVSYDGLNYLITNWHVVTGRNPYTDQAFSNRGVPDTIGIWYHSTKRLGLWILKTEPLFDSTTRTPKWREHPNGKEIDVVALPLTRYEDVNVYPLDLSLAKTDLIISPSEPVSIIGFPFGMAASGKFPIWKTGHVASDIVLDYDGKPLFLIDATTKPGMSGSPVVAKRIGLHRTSTGWVMKFGEIIRFLGIYSGSIYEPSDVGMVWKPEVLNDILPYS